MGIFSWRRASGVTKSWFDCHERSWLLRLWSTVTQRTSSHPLSETESPVIGQQWLTCDVAKVEGVSRHASFTFKRSAGNAWRQKLLLTSSQLNNVSSSTEGEFLTIGERLQEFYQRAGEITNIVSSLVNQLGGEKGTAAINGLAGMLDTLRSHLEEARNQSGRQSLADIMEQLQKVNTPLTGFGQMDKSLKMFSTYTKIESARLGSRAVVFESLAQDVIRLSAAVSDKADTVLSQKNQLTAVIQNALEKAAAMGAEQQAKVLSILEKSNHSLASLANIVDRSTSSAEMISTTAAEVTQNLGQVVVSLQAHDTVRQQVQHVVEALDEVSSRLPESGSFHHRGADDTNLLVATGTLCEIQSAQLRHSSAELMEAVESIITNLREIAAKETGMANDTSELLGVTNQTGESFFSEMEDDLVDVIGMLTATATTNHTLSEVMTTAAETVGGIFHFVDDIDTIAYDIKLIALNFLVQAAHLGHMGGGLGVMAEAINRLSEDARDQAEGITLILNEVKEVTDRMCLKASVDASAMEVRIKEIRQNLEEMLTTLRELHGGMAQGLTQANAMVHQLSANIEEVTAGITVHRKVVAVLDEAETLLAAIGQEAKDQVPESEWLSAREKLQATDKRYTMHSERNIHAAIVNAQAILPTAATPATNTVAAGDGPDLGDNVELF